MKYEIIHTGSTIVKTKKQKAEVEARIVYQGEQTQIGWVITNIHGITQINVNHPFRLEWGEEVKDAVWIYPSYKNQK